MLRAAIDSAIGFEKNCTKLYEKLASASLAPELSKALHPEQTGIGSHIERLQLIKKLIIGKTEIQLSFLTINPTKLKKGKSNTQDLLILHTALQYQAAKINEYETLLAYVTDVLESPVPELISQCIAENEQTSLWLKRTLNHQLKYLREESATSLL